LRFDLGFEVFGAFTCALFPLPGETTAGPTTRFGIVGISFTSSKLRAMQLEHPIVHGATLTEAEPDCKRYLRGSESRGSATI
jgi:hypothetical protein